MRDIIPMLLYIGVGAIGWFTNRLWEADKELRQSLSALREELPRVYVLRADFIRDMDEIKMLLREIRETLSEKADKG